MKPNAIVLQINAVKNGDRILVLPLGQVQGRDGRFWVLTPKDAQAVVAKINSEGVDIVIDYEHGTYLGSGKAAGWLRDFQVDENGITAVAEFTRAAQEAIKNREYRYLSPAFLSEGKRILALESVGLVNTPNLADLPALNKSKTNRGKDMDKELELQIKKLEAEKNDLELQHKEAKAKIKDLETAAANIPAACPEVLDALGLEGDVDKNTVVLAVQSLKAPADSAQKLSAQVADLSAELAVMKRDALVDLALKEGKTSPAEVEAWGKGLAMNSPKEFEKIVLSRARGSVVPVDKMPAAQDETAKAELDGVQREINRQMGINPETFKKFRTQNEKEGD